MTFPPTCANNAVVLLFYSRNATEDLYDLMLRIVTCDCESLEWQTEESLHQSSLLLIRIFSNPVGRCVTQVFVSNENNIVNCP